MAGKAGIPVLGQLPLNPGIVEYADTGRIEDYLNEESSIRNVINDIVCRMSKTSSTMK
jgi:hypothetical protein